MRRGRLSVFLGRASLILDSSMLVTLDLPDELTAVLTAQGSDLSRAALESMPSRRIENTNCPPHSYAACWDLNPAMNSTAF